MEALAEAICSSLCGRRRRCQQDMEKAQQELGEMQIEASAGGGMVSCTVTGLKEIVSIKINPEIVDPEDIEMLEDTVTAAVKEARLRLKRPISERMGRITGGMGGMF